MTDIMVREVSSSSLKEVVNKLLPDSIGKDIEKACQGIYPLHDVYVRKVKILKKPKFDCKFFIVIKVFFLTCWQTFTLLSHFHGHARRITQGKQLVDVFRACERRFMQSTSPGINAHFIYFLF
jgi:hypothetical protein